MHRTKSPCWQLLAFLICATLSQTTTSAQPATQPAPPASPTPSTPTSHPIITPLLGPAVRPWSNEKPLSTIAFGSCARQNRPQPIWTAVNAAQPDLFLFLGDNIYGDTHDMGVLRAKYQQFLDIPGVKTLRQQSVVLATWDDHDFGLNDDGANYPERAQSQQAFLDFWGEPHDTPLRKQQGIYQSRSFGPQGRRVQIILLDTRYHRSPLLRGERTNFGSYAPNPDPAATLLGQDQWQWLEKTLQEPADLRIVVSSIQLLSNDHSYEKWGNFPHERDRILKLLDASATPVLVLSGDRHAGEFSRLKLPSGRHLYDLTSSALNQGTGQGEPNAEPNSLRSGNRINLPHYGLITLNWGAAGSDPKATFELRSVDNQPLVTETVDLHTLVPSR